METICELVSGRLSGRARIRLLFVIGMTVIAVTLLPMSASAHWEGVQWPYSGGLLRLSYDPCVYFSGASDNVNAQWRDAVYYGIDIWSQSPTAPWFYQGSYCGGWRDNVNVWNTALNDGTSLAATQVYSSNGKITGANILLNADTDVYGNYTSFGALNTFGQRAAVLHELGHAIGLAHAGWYAGEYWVPAPYSLMDYCCYFNAPTQHDVDDVHAMYPYP